MSQATQLENQSPPCWQQTQPQSPEVARMSLAAAMTLDFAPGSFYRNACLSCINLLLTYRSGCAAKCAYCGLSGAKEKKESTSKSFIRVTWPAFTLDEIVAGIVRRQERVKRICISMLTNSRAPRDAAEICRRLRQAIDIPVSMLVSPTILTRRNLEELRDAGADKIGVAIDLATPELFDHYRGSGVGGPHSWKRYWQCLGESLDIFGKGMAGAHFMVGMGETEQDMCRAMQRVHDMGGNTHLFSFFPEGGSPLAHRLPPPIDQYRRIQLARWLIDNDHAHERFFTYNDRRALTGYGLSKGDLDAVIDTGEPFRTCGCTGRDGEVACNRPYANSRPGPGIRNYPFKPEEADVRHIRLQMGLPA
ncbi:Radical SAM superfamily protein [anaerobic digester metagenome]|uniref:radical SAM protein n=1 Tax=uncultured Desulfovibrio sp. TaxID=167968 RepID=UPI002601D009|nr:radical SAM protein [uncultured Desulfovibrio sp.]